MRADTRDTRCRVINVAPKKCATKILRADRWGWGVNFSEKKHYDGVRFNVISVTRGGWRSNFQKKALRNT